MKKLLVYLLTSLFLIPLMGCSSLTKTIREPNTHVEFYKNDFIFSNQVHGEAKSVKVLLIDFPRVFKSKSGCIQRNYPCVNFVSIPVIGTLLSDRTSNYALYDMMIKNPGYDVVFYPQYEIEIDRPFFGIGLIVSITSVKVTARLGKILDNTKTNFLDIVPIVKDTIGLPKNIKSYENIDDIKGLKKTDELFESHEPLLKEDISNKKFISGSDKASQVKSKEQIRLAKADSIKNIKEKEVLKKIAIADSIRSIQDEISYKQFTSKHKVGDNIKVICDNIEYSGTIIEIKKEYIILDTVSNQLKISIKNLLSAGFEAVN